MITHSEPKSNSNAGYTVRGFANYTSDPFDRFINLVPKLRGSLFSLGFYCFCYSASLNSA